MVVIKANCGKIANLTLHSEEPQVFFKSQWQRNEKSWIFVVYRWIMAAFFTGIVSYSWTKNIRYGTFRFWFIYMTSWGIFLCMVTTILAAILTTLYHFDKIKINSKSALYSQYSKVYWLLSNVSTVLAFLITIVYWALLFDGISR
jgi:hypothetical protein